MRYRDRYYRKERSVVARHIADQVVLVPIRNNVGDFDQAYTMNEIGGFIWKLINGKRKVEEIKDAITEEFGVSRERAEKDLIYFLTQLEKLELIRQV